MATNQKKNDLKVQWAVLCQNASVDQQTNNLTIFNIVEEMDFNQTAVSNPQIARSVEIVDFPEKTKIPTNFNLVVMLEKIGTWGTDTQGFLEITIFNPIGEIIDRNELPLVTSSSDKRLRVIVSFDGMKVDKSGTYSYSIGTKMGRDERFTKQYETSVEVRIHP